MALIKYLMNSYIHKMATKDLSSMIQNYAYIFVGREKQMYAVA